MVNSRSEGQYIKSRSYQRYLSFKKIPKLRSRARNIIEKLKENNKDLPTCDSRWNLS
jgi:hypothetical protein